MKKIVTLIIVGLTAMYTNGQNPGSILLPMANGLSHTKNSSFGSLLNTHAGSLKYPSVQFGIRSGDQPEKTLAVMQQLDSYVYQEYDAIGSQWVNSSRDDFNYDSNGRDTSDIYSTWNPVSLLYFQESKLKFNYDENGNMITEVFSAWDTITSSWAQTFKWQYSYNSQGNITLGYSYMWDETTSSWLMAEKTERNYDASGNMIEEVNYWWNVGTNDWMNNNKTENIYNSNGRITQTTYYSWDFLGNEWADYSKTEYTYNASGFLILEISFTWNATGSQWVNDTKDEYTYDGNMNMTTDLGYYWSGTAWIVSGKYEYTYNNDYTFNELILPWIFGQGIGEFQHMPTSVTEYTGSSFDPYSRSMFNYSEVNITGIPQKEALPVSVYPQPASGNVTFSWGINDQSLDLEVYDLNWRLLIAQPVDNNGIVSVARLTPGLYFYRLTGSGKTLYTGKLSVR